MPSLTNPNPAAEHRVRSPHTPLVVRAKEEATLNSEAESVYTTDEIPDDSPSPSIKLASLLEREHKINRLQAVELNRAHKTIFDLRLAVETKQNQAPKVDSSRRHERKNASHEIIQLIADNHDLQENLSEMKKALEVKDRQILELETQLHDMSDRLHSALESLKGSDKNEDSYLVPASTFHPLSAAVNAFKDMSNVELTEANMALSHYMAKDRASACTSKPLDRAYMRASPKRPASPFPDMRPQSSQTVSFAQEMVSTQGADDVNYAITPSSRASQKFPSTDISDDSYKLSSKRSVRYKHSSVDGDGGLNPKGKSKGKFSLSGLFSKR